MDNGYNNWRLRAEYRCSFTLRFGLDDQCRKVFGSSVMFPYVFTANLFPIFPHIQGAAVRGLVSLFQVRRGAMHSLT